MEKQSKEIEVGVHSGAYGNKVPREGKTVYNGGRKGRMKISRIASSLKAKQKHPRTPCPPQCDHENGTPLTQGCGRKDTSFSHCQDC